MSEIRIFFTYFLLAALLFGLAETYLKLASRLGIADTPNLRSSHLRPTIRGGGVVFVVGMMLFLLLNLGSLAWFTASLAIGATVGFLDDLGGLPKRIRITGYFIASALLLYQVGIPLTWYLWLPLLVLVAGIVNAVNFMDGINGITGLYGLVAFVTLWWLHRAEGGLLPDAYFLVALVGLAVFGFYNFRPRARCFAGDVGSIGLALMILLPLIMLVITRQSLAYLLLLSLYGVDTILTIVFRLANRENIFQAHRRHLFQLLANEGKISHLKVAFGYALAQTFVNVLVIGQHIAQLSLAGQIAWITAILSGASLAFLVLRRRVLRRQRQSVAS
ncbi:MAG: UDP-GlcNAc--UDP-phosphate GlcNAc-1-phosphate transferase [Bernardetiaceae bacterium]|jgi:UDP-N-acetylmuramyl pentapeptide phosphotransferase/UDP-N-acetylglucosamine-1-phosphate transferase|nr:UDP-GlcNAc--UDP-phosphate GlcNAc-1-phosphate transferase [Bernardetiaceae bacterium]